MVEDPHYFLKYPLAGSRIPLIIISLEHMPSYVDNLDFKLGLTYYSFQVEIPIANGIMCLI